jgi:uncharacterized membrane protein YeaQ/YmgE (transglycosylase-associated protein family)
MTIGSVIGWIIFGLIAGLIARLLVSERDLMGGIATIAPGIVGAVVDGLIADASLRSRGGRATGPAHQRP